MEVVAEFPPPMAFFASCAAVVHGEWAMLLHGGVGEMAATTAADAGQGGEESEGAKAKRVVTLADLWAFRLKRSAEKNGLHAHQQGHNSASDAAEFSWERLLPRGEG